jgi:hypothetical protein
MLQRVLAYMVGIVITAHAAHHTLTSVYDSSRQMSIEGVIAQFQFINPHPFVIVDVKSDDGRMRQWKLEMDNRYELADIGMTEETLKPGDRVIVSGSPGRSQPQILYIRKLDRPSDGFQYEQVGSSPRARFPKP